MLVNLYDNNLNYVKTVSEKDIDKKENKNLFSKMLQLHIYDHKSNLIFPKFLNTIQSETYEDAIIRLFREYYEITDLKEKQIEFVEIKTCMNEIIFNGNVFLYNINIKLNKNQTKIVTNKAEINDYI